MVGSDAARRDPSTGPGSDAMPGIVLHHFPSSHYNEKARWALDWKGVAHERRSYLPGPHAPWIRRLSGQTATPVLRLDGGIAVGSAAIVDALERRFPERPLYPQDPDLRRRALEIQRHFDAEVGPAVRAAVFSVLLEEPDYLCATFAAPKPRAVRRLYRAGFPLLKGIMARANGAADPQQVERAFERSRRALDFVAKEVGPSGQLVGNGFSVADLCCASLLAPLVDPGHPDMARLRPLPERVEAFLRRFASHPGAEWVLGQYARHRRACCAL